MASAMFWFKPCLKISHLPLRSELKIMALLSRVQLLGKLPRLSSVKRRGCFTVAPSGPSSPKYTSCHSRVFWNARCFPSAVMVRPCGPKVAPPRQSFRLAGSFTRGWFYRDLPEAVAFLARSRVGSLAGREHQAPVGRPPQTWRRDAVRVTERTRFGQARFRYKGLRGAAADGPDLDGSTPGTLRTVLPTHIGDPAAVGRPGWAGHALVLFHQLSWRLAVHPTYPDFGGPSKGNQPSVRRDC